MLVHVSPKKYTEAVQKRLGCKTKPEPWLHIAAVGDGNSFMYKRTGDDKDAECIHYAIYVWDTRQVVESGKIDNKSDVRRQEDLLNFLRTTTNRRLAMFHAQRAKDNYLPLAGNDESVKLINSVIFSSK